MKRAMVFGAVGVVLLLASSGWAGAPICNGAVALRVNQKGLDFVLEQVKPHIPHTLDTPAVDYVVVDWPLTDSDATAHVPPVKLSLNLKQLLAQMDGGGLRVQGKADVTGGTDFKVDNPYVGLGSTTCTADVALRDLDVDLSLSFGTSANRINATVNHAKISFSDTSVIAVKGCTVGSILSALVDFVRSHFMGTVQSLMEKLAKEKISALITDKLDETIELTKEVRGYVFTGRLEALQTDGAGVSVGLGVGLRPKKEVTPSCLAGSDLTPPQTCSGVPVQLSATGDSMFGAGLSEAVLNQALHMVWRSGMLCISSEDPRLATITQGLDKLTAGLNQPPGTKLGFALRLARPPRVRTTIQSGLELVLDEVQVRLTLSPPGGPPGEVVIDAGVSVGAVPWIDPATNSVTLDLRKVSVAHLDLKGKDGAPSPLSLDPARLQRFITTVMMPVVRERLSQLPLSASVVAIQGYQIELKTFQVSDGFIAAYIDGHMLKPTGNKGPPDTILKEGPPSAVGPQVLRLAVVGRDNFTPAALIRFRARVDGGAWTEAKYGGRIDVTVTGGHHVVEVAAVDHDDNVDPSPLNLHFDVDDVMPQLTITSRPPSLVEDDHIELSFTGSDDRTPPETLSFVVELHRVPDGGGMPEVVRTVQVQPGSQVVRLDDIPDGVYKARVIVADAVGNVTSQDVGFVVASDGGCSYIGGGRSVSGAGMLLLLLLLSLLLAVRRRTSRD